MAAPSTWIFQASPGDWLLKEQLAAMPLLQWKVSRYASSIKVGDTVFMWESKPTEAVLAVVTVTRRPRVEPLAKKNEPFCLKPSVYGGDICRAWLRVDHVLQRPLTRSELLEHEQFHRQQPIGGGSRGTNFHVPEPGASLLQELASAR